jgi:hypothetical protein
MLPAALPAIRSLRDYFPEHVQAGMKKRPGMLQAALFGRSDGSVAFRDAPPRREVLNLLGQRSDSRRIFIDALLGCLGCRERLVRGILCALGGAAGLGSGILGRLGRGNGLVSRGLGAFDVID